MSTQTLTHPDHRSRKYPIKPALLYFVPLVAGSTLWASPGLAASFAFSEASAFLSNFSQAANASDSFANSTLITRTGAADAVQEPVAEGFTDFENAIFFPESGDRSNSFNTLTNEVFGSGPNFLVSAVTEAAAIADFFIDPGSAASETFSFDLSLSLFLETTVLADAALASGDISIEICGREAPGTALLFCDFLSVSGLRQNTGDNDVSIQASSAFNIAGEDLTRFEDTAFAPGLQQETQQLEIFASGAFQREFTTPIFLTLIQTTETSAEVTAAQTPEPSGLIGIVLGTGLMLGRVRQPKNRQSQKI